VPRNLVDHGTSPISLNAAITGLKFFVGITPDRGELMAKMQSVFVPRTLPVVLSREEVVRLIGAAGHNLRVILRKLRLSWRLFLFQLLHDRRVTVPANVTA
jgi:hypothetical protein